MNTEEIIKNKTDEYINNLKEDYMKKGLFITERDEMYLRIGIAQGICISGLALVNIESDKLIFKES